MKQRTLLAVLVACCGTTVSADRLLDALWGDSPPPSALENLRSYVSKLRRSLGHRVEAVPGGYRLRLAPSECDADRCAELAEYGDAAAERGDARIAATQYRAALEVWRGPAYGDLADHPQLRQEAARLEELRLIVLERRVDADLACGRHQDLAAELAKLTAEHPLRERFCAQYMLALARSGRQGEALYAYQQMARGLADELGIDPGTELRALHQAILTDDPAVLRGGDDVPAQAPVPAQLPAATTHFTGRAGQLRRLVEVLQPGALVAVTGTGGVGKTALALEAAYAVRDRYPGGQLYANLRGAGDRPEPPDTVLTGFLRALGVDRIPPRLQEAAALFRTITADRGMFVLLDNAADEEQVRPLLPGTGDCTVIITARSRLTALNPAHAIDLDVLHPDEAMRLLTAVVGAERVEREPRAALETVMACGLLPLAIRITSARLPARPTWTIASVAGRLAAPERRLGELRAGDLDLTRTFALSYRQLRSEQALAFRRLALADGPDLDVDAAAIMLDRGAAETEDILETLVDLNLLSTGVPGRYHYHDLLLLYARRVAETEDTASEVGAALLRLLGYYTATARSAIEILDPHETPPCSLLGGTVAGCAFTDVDMARAWLSGHVPHLFAALEQGVSRAESIPLATDLLNHVKWIQRGGMGWARGEDIARRLACAAVRLGDQRSEALARNWLGVLLYRQHRLPEAMRHLERSVTLCRDGDDPVLLSRSLHALGFVHYYQRRLDDSIAVREEAILVLRELGEPSTEAFAHTGLARCHSEAGRQDQALACLTRAAEAAKRSGAPLAKAVAEYEHGIFLREQGDYERASARFREALCIAERADHGSARTLILYHWAETHRLAGRTDEAATKAQECLTLAKEIEDDFNAARALTILGRTLPDDELAQQCLSEARSILDTLGSTPEAGDL
ncbi:BTAD domain-containing putative transcriptional regulator [Nonomuraea sp. CA-143628]|uniref:AfsR/SARP family transcriptional regulator n=1 Tax=Nonomuraea sp. CA-143628 TaxID=3239997 RepID=UPI003D8CDCFB